MLDGPMPWQHSWQSVWVKKELKSTSDCWEGSIVTLAIGSRMLSNLQQGQRKVHRSRNQCFKMPILATILRFFPKEEEIKRDTSC
jgi:hypothetical protein